MEAVGTFDTRTNRCVFVQLEAENAIDELMLKDLMEFFTSTDTVVLRISRQVADDKVQVRHYHFPGGGAAVVKEEVTDDDEL